MKRTTILVAALCAASALLGWFLGHRKTCAPEAITAPIVKTDTVVKHDTVIIRQPPEKSRRRIATRRFVVADTVSSGEVELPVVSVMYADSLYDAWISGIEPRLDSIRLKMPVTEIHSSSITLPKVKPRRWGIGLGARLTATTDGRIAPGVFVGVTYNFFGF